MHCSNIDKKGSSGKLVQIESVSKIYMIEITNDGASHDEVLLKIGRNMLNFQKMELMLKTLLATDNNPGKLSQNGGMEALGDTALNKVTLGQLAPKYIDEFFTLDEDASEGEDTPFRIKVVTQTSVQEKEHVKQSWEELVRVRNTLVHIKFGKFNPDSEEECLKMISFLDQQHERMAPLFHSVSSRLELVEAMVSILKDFPDLCFD